MKSDDGKEMGRDNDNTLPWAKRLQPLELSGTGSVAFSVSFWAIQTSVSLDSGSLEDVDRV